MSNPPLSGLTPLAGSVSNEVIRYWDVAEDRMSWFGNVGEYLGSSVGDRPTTQEGFLARIHPDRRDTLSEQLSRWLESETETWSTSYPFRGPDDEWLEVHERGRVVRGDGGRARAVIASLLEVSRRSTDAGEAGGSREKHRPREGREERDIYRALAEHASDIITVMMPDGEIRYESPSLKRILGYEPEDLVGRNAFELIHPEDRERVRRAWEAGPGDAGFVDTVEYRCRHADGSWRHLESSGRRPPGGSEIDGVLVHSRDVTERRELERRLQEAQKLEAVGRLVSGIAHDFNNLLTVITCDTDILLQDLDEGDPRRAAVGEIHEAAERAGRLTRDLLAFGRQENLRMREIDLVRAFRDVTPVVNEKLGDGVEFELQAECDEAWVRVDPPLARQVLFEVVSNSKDAMPDGGTFRIEVRKVQVGPDSPVSKRGVEAGDWVAVAYADTGRGMPDEVLQRVFEPFFSTKEKSSGLGLSSVHGLVKQSDGEVWIESAPGEGTTVWIYLPDVGCPAEPT